MQPRPFKAQQFSGTNTENPRNMNIGSRRSMAGLTLVEVLVVSMLVAVIAAIALPAYQEQVRKGRRAEGRAMLIDVMNREHRFFADNSAYTTDITGSLSFNPATSENGHYALAVTSIGATVHVLLTASPQGGQVNDTECGSLTLSTTGAKGTTGGGDKCW